MSYLLLSSALRAADRERGKSVFERCAACHSVGEEAKAGGPALKGVFGRKAASREDYRYSVAMQRSGVVWTVRTLDAYIADPQGFIKGNRMSFAGVFDRQQREDLIAFLQEATK